VELELDECWINLEQFLNFAVHVQCMSKIDGIGGLGWALGLLLRFATWPEFWRAGIIASSKKFQAVPSSSFCIFVLLVEIYNK
jgi:hypothetical protein